MAFQSLYRRYRPRRFGEVRGQDHVVAALRNAVSQGTASHAYLFSGPRGTGKTSTARILAKALNCEAPVDGEPCCVCASCVAVEAGTSLDVSELDAASNNGVDAMRDLVARVALAGAGRTRLYILDEVHMLSSGAANALLKTLEEPPPHVVFVLATTDPQKVLPTIRSRTQPYEFRLLSADTLGEHLRWVVADAGLDVGDDVVDQAVRRGRGSARDALSALDQLVAAGGTSDDDGAVDEMVEALCDRDTGRALVAVADACAAGRDPSHLADALLAHLRDAFLSVVAPDVVSLPGTAKELVTDQGRRLGAPATVRALDALGEAIVAMREAPDPRVALEVALVRVTRPEADTSVAALLERVERLERALRGGAAGAAPGPSETVPTTASSGARDAARQAVRAVTDTAGEAEPESLPRRLPDARSSSSVPARPALGAMGGTGHAHGPSPPAPPTASASTPARPHVAADAPAPNPLPSRDELTLAWADHLLDGLRPVAKGLFGTGRFAAVDDRGATFALPTDVMRARCESRRGEVETALAAHFGRPVPLRLTTDASDASLARGGPPDPFLVEPVDLDDLHDAPPDRRSPLERLTDAFPGAEVVDRPSGDRP